MTRTAMQTLQTSSPRFLYSILPLLAAFLMTGCYTQMAMVDYDDYDDNADVEVYEEYDDDGNRIATEVYYDDDGDNWYSRPGAYSNYFG
ncbi:MAG: hypothetical protein ACI84D_003229, partial [Thalassolituus oleivorans]